MTAAKGVMGRRFLDREPDPIQQAAAKTFAPCQIPTPTPNSTSILFFFPLKFRENVLSRHASKKGVEDSGSN